MQWTDRPTDRRRPSGFASFFNGFNEARRAAKMDGRTGFACVHFQGRECFASVSVINASGIVLCRDRARAPTPPEKTAPTDRPTAGKKVRTYENSNQFRPSTPTWLTAPNPSSGLAGMNTSVYGHSWEDGATISNNVHSTPQFQG